MTIHIENADTQELLTKDGRWTRNPKEAAAYRSSTVAKETGATAQVGRFNVIGAFKNSGQITNLDEGTGAAK